MVSKAFVNELGATPTQTCILREWSNCDRICQQCKISSTRHKTTRAFQKAQRAGNISTQGLSSTMQKSWQEAAQHNISPATFF
jgi:hypothetical protein